MQDRPDVESVDMYLNDCTGSEIKVPLEVCADSYWRPMIRVPLGSFLIKLSFNGAAVREPLPNKRIKTTGVYEDSVVTVV